MKKENYNVGIKKYNINFMGRKTIWVGKFKSLKVKVYDETLDRYKLVLRGRKKTIQQDLEDYINRTINQ